MTTGAEQECNWMTSKLKASRSKKILEDAAHLHFAASVGRRREKRDTKRENVPSLVLRQEVGHGQWDMGSWL
eukprot:scaffold14362_cov87-Skeletonema_dohrnii-CCMP3373.AAC.2